MVALEVGLPSLPPPPARSLPPSARAPRAPSFPLHPPPRLRPPRLRAAGSQPLAARAQSQPLGVPSRPPLWTGLCGPRTEPPSLRGGRGAGGGGAAGRSPGRNQGWAGGGDAGVPEPRSRSERTSVAGGPGRRSTAGANRAAHKVRCPGGARARGGRRGAEGGRPGAARRWAARRGSPSGRRRARAARPERAPCPARADGPEPARSGRAGQVGGGPSPGTRVGAGPATRPTPELAHSLARSLAHFVFANCPREPRREEPGPGRRTLFQLGPAASP